jgi:orotidine-5'-phosphate decarboxylase
VSKRQKSLIVAGCDPAVGTPNLVEWCKKYIEEVAPFVAAIKPNPAYFQSVVGMEALKMITDFCKEKNLVSMADYKISDIGSTNEAWIKHCAMLGFDGITIAPYAGNIKETIEFCKKNNCAPIMMGLMSNPEFIRETDFETTPNPSLAGGEEGQTRSIKLWKYRVDAALKENVDALVLGATYKKDDLLLQDFAQIVNKEENNNVIFLVPGIGVQGGTTEDFLGTMKSLEIDAKRCMLNVGRSLMNATDRGVEAKRLQETCANYI